MNTPKSVRILICTGHTGGHFFPAASFAEAFKKSHPETEIHMLINRMAEFSECFRAEHSFHFHIIPLLPLPPFFSFKMLLFLLQCIAAFYRTFFVFVKIKPALVVGFGSFSSVPGILWAAFFRKPILLHEQNAAIGRANQFLSRWANQIAVSFPETQGKFSRSKVFWSGYPLRSSFLHDLRETQNEQAGQKPFTILVFGGSQGAKRLNHTFLEALKVVNAEERSCFAVIHNVGKDDLQGIKQRYQELGIVADVCTFSYQIAEQYKRADLVLARAGAGTIFELAAVGRAAVLMPYPHAYAHQKLNANYLVSRNAARVINDDSLSASTLRNVIFELKAKPDQRNQLGRNIQHLAKREANRILVEAGWKLICEKN